MSYEFKHYIYQHVENAKQEIILNTQTRKCFLVPKLSTLKGTNITTSSFMQSSF